VEIDPGRDTVRVVGDDADRVRELATRVGRRASKECALRAQLVPRENGEPPGAHLLRVRRAQELIRAGDLYQVNLARRRSFHAVGPPFDLYRRFASRVRAPYGACLTLGDVTACAVSPELFLRVDPDGRMWTAPIKGTRPRGRDAERDAELATELEQSAKENAELTMIVDVERNDFGKVAEPGSVRLLGAPRVASHPTVHHRGAVVQGKLCAAKTASDVLRATFPSGSVTGAPKVRAMEVIAELEPVRRGLYTGAFGWVGFDGTLELAMAIRVLTLRSGEAHYFAGGGIVADSDPEAELAETQWKGVQLEALLEPAESCPAPRFAFTEE
jgi:anthranilate/para-aminobenzoate synthase component I